jgi:hypothetical protein
MTEKEREAMRERRRAGYTRSLRAIRNEYGLPALSNVQRTRLLDALERVQGDAPGAQDLRCLHRLASRGLFDN